MKKLAIGMALALMLFDAGAAMAATGWMRVYQRHYISGGGGDHPPPQPDRPHPGINPDRDPAPPPTPPRTHPGINPDRLPPGGGPDIQ